METLRKTFKAINRNVAAGRLIAWVYHLLFATHSKEHVVIANDRNVDAVTFEQ
jgi:hypothetical protein